MIKINLIPEELEQKRKFSTYIFALSGVGVGILLILVLIVSILGLQVKVQAKRYNRLDEEWKVIEEQEKEVLGLENLRIELGTKKKAIEDLAQSRLLWSKKLYQLSRQVLPSIWLIDLSMTKRTEKIKLPVTHESKSQKRKEVAPRVTWVQKTYQTMLLKGMVISLAGEEMIDSIGKFMTSLKNDEDFFQHFYDIELVVSQKKAIQDREAMTFELACRLK